MQLQERDGDGDGEWGVEGNSEKIIFVFSFLTEVFSASLRPCVWFLGSEKLQAGTQNVDFIQTLFDALGIP